MAELNYQDELAPERTQAEFEIEEVEIKPSAPRRALRIFGLLTLSAASLFLAGCALFFLQLGNWPIAGIMIAAFVLTAWAVAAIGKVVRR